MSENALYEAKENARAELADAVRKFFDAAGEYGAGAYDIGHEIADTVYDSTEQSVKLKVEDQ